MQGLAVALLVVSMASAQNPSNAKETQLLKNARVTVSRVEISGPSLIKHEHDAVIVVVDQGLARTKGGAPDVFFSPGGADGPNLNNGTRPQQAVMVEFVAPQGRVQAEKPRSSRYCNPGSKTACVDEKYLFCTEKVCLEDVTMGVGAVTTKHSHDTDHMLVAVTDYSLTDDIASKGVKVRTVPSGGVEYIPAGITHTLTNTSGKEIRFVVVVFR